MAIGYLRVSTDKQHLGPDAQRAAIVAWAAPHGIQIVSWHADQDTSGGSELADRPGLIDAIGAIRAYRAGLLAVARRDRLARSVEVAVTLEREIRSAGAIVASADGHNDDGPSGKLIRQIEDALAEHERELISARTKGALAVKRSRGQFIGNAPYGFRRASGGPVTKKGLPVGLEPDEGEQAVCTRVMEMRDQGMSEQAIESELRWSVRSRGGHSLGPSQVHAIIANCAELRRIFPAHARSAPAGVFACARGHIYETAWDGKYCVRGECKAGRGDGDAARRIELRDLTMVRP